MYEDDVYNFLNISQTDLQHQSVSTSSDTYQPWEKETLEKKDHQEKVGKKRHRERKSTKKKWEKETEKEKKHQENVGKRDIKKEKTPRKRKGRKSRLRRTQHERLETNEGEEEERRVGIKKSLQKEKKTGNQDRERSHKD